MRLRLSSLGFTLLNFLPVLSQYTKDSYSGRMTADGIPIEELGRVKRFKLDREPKHDDEEPDFPELDDDAWRFSQRNMQADDETFDDDHEFQRDRHKAIPNKVDSAGNAPKTYGFTVGDGLATGEVVGGLKT